MNYLRSDAAEMGWSAIFRYDLNTGRLIKKYVLFEPDRQHLFNDIVVTRKGDVYFTDSRSHQIFRINRKKDKIETYIQNEAFGFLNGITLAPDEKSIYVADDGVGMMRINLKSRKIHYLSGPENSALIGTDGLYFYKNSLIAVQNGLGGMARISRFFLDKKGDHVARTDCLELGNPHFVIPTTGVITGEDFWYIANSQLASFSADHTIFPDDELRDVVILKIELK